MPRKPFIAGNWKMNLNRAAAVELAGELAEKLASAGQVDLAVFPPFVYLSAVAEKLSGTGVAVGAQDVFYEGNGAYTGEVSTEMLSDVGATMVLCGHSERRHVIGETDERINRKLLKALGDGLRPILCVGELLAEREANETLPVVRRQVQLGLEGVSAADMAGVTLAYEPVWAIGTGKVATTEQAQEVHAMIRGLLEDLYDASVAAATRIQYGGSVKPGNAAELLGCEDIDGALVGGASLKAADFAGIVAAAK
jgi:triosephosphate isomerase